jgi:hypothetical protein
MNVQQSVNVAIEGCKVCDDKNAYKVKYATIPSVGNRLSKSSFKIIATSIVGSYSYDLT